MDAIDPAAPGAAPGDSNTPAPSWMISSVGVSGLTAASIVLLLLYLTGRFLWQYNKDAAAAVAAAGQSATTAAASSSGPASSPPRRGGAAVSLLPVFVHAGAECAVCLAEFAAQGEAGRALPRCGHAFHEECIAAWLRVHTTCPLCRAPVAAAKDF